MAEQVFDLIILGGGPAGYNAAYLKVYYISTDGSGSTQLLKSYIDGNYICFETTHLSFYAIVDESPDQQTETSGANACPYCGKTHTGAFGKLTAFFHRILYFFAHLFGKM